jgi:hypothetical protein
MSGISGVNRAAAASVAGGDEATIQVLTVGLGLIHVLQVYTSSMVCIPSLFIDANSEIFSTSSRLQSQHGTGWRV